ncbi:hypothetical protein MD484_g6248, partial [Candolleomyces efflorescens]
MAKITSPTQSKNVATAASKPIGEVKIRRPENCFMLFKRAFALKNGNAIRSQQVLCKAASQAWHAMSEEEQAPWRELQEVVKAEHARKYPDYVYNPKQKASKRGLAKRDAALVLPSPPLPTAPLVTDTSYSTSSVSQLTGMGGPMAQPQMPLDLDGAVYNSYSDYFIQRPVQQQQTPFGFFPSQATENFGTPGQYDALDVGLDWNGVSYPAMPMEPGLFDSFYGASAPGMDLASGSTAPFDFDSQFFGASNAGGSNDFSYF